MLTAETHADVIRVVFRFRIWRTDFDAERAGARIHRSMRRMSQVGRDVHISLALLVGSFRF
jgi:hypothetical protein